jgi:hypothetical protein
LYIEVTYDKVIYNDLPLLVEETPEMKGKVKQLTKSPFNFSKFIERCKERKDHIKKISICYCNDISEDCQKLISSLKSLGLKVEEIKC